MPSKIPPSSSDSDRSANRAKTNPNSSPHGHAADASDDADEMDFEQTLREVEQNLLMLKARYAQVQSDQQLQRELTQQLTQTQKQVLQTRSQKRQSELKRELKKIKQQLEETELALESQLFSWSGLREVFWQAVRFGGIGVVLGWLLKSWAG
ncbi:MAG: hypothetical protein MUF49_09465 [Oculatellaceae cyanobacterium Prado106]|jgi:hypothetical protein|nr:hypothetical protein [Oculatellaceae cyanobacterium Prado106]